MKTMKAFLMAWWFLALTAVPGVYAKKPVTPLPLDSLKHQIVQLEQEIQDLKDGSFTADTMMTSVQKAFQDLLQSQIQDLSDKVNSVSDAQKKVLPGEFNPAIGVVGEEITSYNTKGMNENGSGRPGGIDVDLRSVELNVASSIDPFVKGYAVVNASADPQTGEATWGVEEAALQTTALPLNLELKAGRFFGEFGRLSDIHDHELPMIYRPLALDQYVGGESQSDGFQVNWLVPIPQYLSLTAGAGDRFGGDIQENSIGNFRNFSELNYWARLSSYFDLTPDWQAEMGVSGLFNPSTDSLNGIPTMVNDSLIEKERRLAGVDFSLKWAPLRNNQFQSLTWGNEVLYSDNRYVGTLPGNNTTLVDTSIGALGLYSYLTWKFSREWSVSFLVNWVENQQVATYRTTQYSPYITWALSHWNQLRLEYTHTENTDDQARGLADNDELSLQWQWIIGAHSHGWQQR
jgi:hypothetical protein